MEAAAVKDINEASVYAGEDGGEVGGEREGGCRVRVKERGALS